MHESVDRPARLLVATIMIVVGLVLLVACTNVANLVLARGAARRHETAVRLALGASRWRLIRGQLVEAVLLALAGAAAAFVVARVLMARLLSGDLLLVPGIRLRFEPEMNTSVACAALASTALALVVFGVIPALRASKGSVRDAMASDGQNVPVPRWRGRRADCLPGGGVGRTRVSGRPLRAADRPGAARHRYGHRSSLAGPGQPSCGADRRVAGSPDARSDPRPGAAASGRHISGFVVGLSDRHGLPRGRGRGDSGTADRWLLQLHGQHSRGVRHLGCANREGARIRRSRHGRVRAGRRPDRTHGAEPLSGRPGDRAADRLAGSRSVASRSGRFRL